MSLLGFTYFLEVAKEGNISKAAEKLFVSQQSLSAHIKRLEEQYKVTLFERKPALKLTPAGKAMFFYVQQILKEEADMKDHFADILTTHQGDLHLGISRQREEAFFRNIWERYHEIYPNINVFLHEQNSEQLLEMLRTHQIDVAVGVNIPESRDLLIEPLVNESLCCSLSKTLLCNCRPDSGEQDYERYVKEGVDLLELQDLPFFHRPKGNQIRQAVDALYAVHSAYPHCILETNNQQLMLQLNQYGVGLITPLYLYICWQNQSLGLGIPKIVKIKNEIVTTKVSLVTLKDRKLPIFAETMKDLIRKEFAQYKRIINKLGDFSLVE